MPRPVRQEPSTIYLCLSSEQLTHWFLQEFLGLLILALTLFALFQLMNFSLAGIKKKILQRSEKEAKSNTQETEKRLKYAFDAERIEIPFPHTTVYWGEEIHPLKLELDTKQ